MPNILNSPRGHNAFRRLTIQDSNGNDVAITCNSTSLILDDGIRLSDGTNTLYLSVDASGLIIPGRVTVNSVRNISANSTGFIFGAQAAKPSARSASKVTFLTNSTGNNAIVINTTGTTWKYCNVTSVLPT